MECSSGSTRPTPKVRRDRSSGPDDTWAASVDSWEEFSANELLRRQRRFRAVAHLRGPEERREATVLSLVHLRAGGDQRRGDLGVALLAGDEDRRVAIAT